MNDAELLDNERLRARVAALEKERDQYLEWYTICKAALIEAELRESMRTRHPELIA